LPACNGLRAKSAFLGRWALAGVALALGLAGPGTARALLRIDFEQAIFAPTGMAVMDFCVLRVEGMYHIFYHAMPEGPSPASQPANAIYHATSPDLVHWDECPPAIMRGPEAREGRGVWAPDVIWDAPHGQWRMFYAAADSLWVQRPCAAWSTDLYAWTKAESNPCFLPDSLQYYWAPSLEWSSFRDPFLYFADGAWQMLSTAGLRLGGYPGTKRGIVHRAVSTDLENWTDAGPFWVHDGSTPLWHDLESPQYLVRGGWHHLFVTEQNVAGVCHMVADTAGAWTMASRDIVDYGYAAEIDQFDPGVDIFSRYVIGRHLDSGDLFYVARFDTLRWLDGGRVPQVWKPMPLDKAFAYRTGNATYAQPTWGDNLAERGEPSSGPVGHGWFGSQEFYQGPGSNRGSPGAYLGDAATGTCESYPFTIEGDFIHLRVGGGNYPGTCYVALVAADADTILASETGTGVDLMTERVWNVRAWRGRLAYVRIADEEAGPFGHINVDEIEEVVDPVTDVGAGPADPAAGLTLEAASPNPFNAATAIRFTLHRPGPVEMTIYDTRGRVVHRLPPRQMDAGDHAISWRGQDERGLPVSTGVYVYRLRVAAGAWISGRLTLVK
jgi:hypothetical protein